MGKIGESNVSIGKRRLGIPKGVVFYLKLRGEETIEWLTTTTDLTPEELADDCLIVKVVRK